MDRIEQNYRTDGSAWRDQFMRLRDRIESAALQKFQKKEMEGIPRYKLAEHRLRWHLAGFEQV